MNNHWQQRVRVEHEEVSGRVKRLLDFLESEKCTYIPKAERLRLLTQLDIMRQYRDILKQRMDAHFQ